MDQLYNEVKTSLDGLVISQLQNIINEFLPDRAVMSSYHLIGIAHDNGGTIVIQPKNGPSEWVNLDDLRGGGAGAKFAPTKFDVFTLDFAPFIPMIESAREPGTHPYYSATIIYHGEPEIIQIARTPQSWVFFNGLDNLRPDKVWTNSMIQSNNPSMAL